MGASSIGGKPKDLQNFLSQNFGFIATVLSFLVLTLRLLQVGGGRKENAIFILAHADKLPLLVGLILPIMPALTIFLAVICMKIAFGSNFATSEFTKRVSIVIWIPLMFIGFKTGSWSALLVGVTYGILLLDIPISKILPKNRKKETNSTPGPHRLFRGREYDIDVYFTLILLSILAFPTPQTWVPSECITLADGSQISGSVISSDTKFTYVMSMPGHAPIVLSTDKISERIVLTDAKNLVCTKQKTNKVPSGSKDVRRPNG